MILAIAIPLGIQTEFDSSSGFIVWITFPNMIIQSHATIMIYNYLSREMEWPQMFVFNWCCFWIKFDSFKIWFVNKSGRDKTFKSSAI